MNTSQRRQKNKTGDDAGQLSAAAIAAAASRKSANRSSRFGGLKGAIVRSSLPVLVNVRSSFSDKLAASCRFNNKGGDSDDEAETAPSSTTGDELIQSQSPEKKAWDSVSTLGLHGPNGPDISSKSIACSAKSLRIPSVPDIDDLEPSTLPLDQHPGAAADQDVSVDLVPEAFLQTNHPPTDAAKEVKQGKHGKRSSTIRSSKRTSSGSHDHNRKNKSTTTTSTSEAEAEIMRIEIQELKAMLKEKTQTIVKLEVDLELANDTIHELKKSLVHSRKNEKAVGHRISSKSTSTRQPSSGRSAMNLYLSRLSQTEE